MLKSLILTLTLAALLTPPLTAQEANSETPSATSEAADEAAPTLPALEYLSADDYERTANDMRGWLVSIVPWLQRVFIKPATEQVAATLERKYQEQVAGLQARVDAAEGQIKAQAQEIGSLRRKLAAANTGNFLTDLLKIGGSAAAGWGICSIAQAHGANG